MQYARTGCGHRVHRRDNVMPRLIAMLAIAASNNAVRYRLNGCRIKMIGIASALVQLFERF